MPDQPDLMLVTGAAGFIGSHLAAALLKRGHRVVGIDNFDPFYARQAKRRNISAIVEEPGRAGAFELIEGDICDAQTMREVFTRAKPRSVFHIAALAGVRPSIAQPERYVRVNVDGLVTVLEAAKASGCARIVFASSSSVYGNNPTVPFAEDDAVDRPISPYAATKRAGELICQSHAHAYGLRIAALRFFTVYGPAQRPDLAISTFMRLIAAGAEVPMFGDGTTSRDYTYIDDVIAGVLAAHEKVSDDRSRVSEKDAPGGGEGFFRIYNLGSDHPIALAEMIDSIAKVVGKPARVKRLPMQQGDVERTWADLTRSRAELGYSPTMKFMDGLRLQRDWLLHAGARRVPELT